MKQETSIVARKCRLQEWAFMIQDCNDRPHGMTVKQWCLEHDITPANYYYRLKEVRKACLDSLAFENMDQRIVPVSAELLAQKEEVQNSSSGLEVSVNGISIHVTDHADLELLKMVLQVAKNA